jgi:hypothetical protein
MRSVSLVKLIDILLGERSSGQDLRSVILKHLSKECEFVSNTWQRRGGRLMERVMTIKRRLSWRSAVILADNDTVYLL